MHCADRACREGGCQGSGRPTSGAESADGNIALEEAAYTRAHGWVGSPAPSPRRLWQPVPPRPAFLSTARALDPGCSSVFQNSDGRLAQERGERGGCHLDKTGILVLHLGYYHRPPRSEKETHPAETNTLNSFASTTNVTTNLLRLFGNPSYYLQIKTFQYHHLGPCNVLNTVFPR